MKNKDCSKELHELFESEDSALFVAKERQMAPTADDRLAESFLEIVNFVSTNDRRPRIDAEDFGEQLLAKRLDGIMNSPDKIEALEKFDSLGLLVMPEAPKTMEELINDDAFGIFSGEENKIFDIKHVKQRTVVNSSEDRAVRMKSEDFSIYKPFFEEAQHKLKSGESNLVLFKTIDQLRPGGLDGNGGQMVYVAEEGEIDQKAGYKQQRLRVIIENGTESNMYKRSLAQRLYEGGSCVVSKDEVVEEIVDETERVAGYIYILRSLSKDSKINTIANLHKIGFSTTSVSKRIANAKEDPTYLMADVEVVESYRLTGDYNPQKVEHMIHGIFADAALDLNIINKDGREYKPMEWYSVPIQVIREAVDLISSGEIVHYVYDSKEEKIRQIE